MQEFFGDFNPALLVVFVLGLVELVKKLGVTGEKLTVVSMMVGAALGVLYQLGVIYPAIMPWVQVVVYGGLTGLSASGLYDLGKRFAAGAQNATGGDE